MISSLFSTLGGAISGFFQKFALILMAVAIAGLTLFGGITYWKYTSAVKDNAALKLAVSNLKAEVTQKTLEVSGLQRAIKMLERTNHILGEKLAEESAIDKDIDNAKPEDDAPIAPVLRRTLDGVDRLLHGKS